MWSLPSVYVVVMLTGSDPRGAGNTVWKVPSGRRIRCWAHSGPPVRIFNQSVTTTNGDSATGNESLKVGAWFGADIWLNRIQGSRRQREAAHPKGRRRSDNSCPPGSKCAQHDQALKSAAAPLEELALALAMSPSQSAERETPLAMTDGRGSRWYRADRSRGEPLRGTGWKMHPASPAEARRGHQQRASSTVWEKSRRLCGQLAVLNPSF